MKEKIIQNHESIELENLKIFSDIILLINPGKNQVSVIHNNINPKSVGGGMSFVRFGKYLEKSVEPSFRIQTTSRFSRESLESLGETVSFETRIYGEKHYPYFQCALSPWSDGSVLLTARKTNHAEFRKGTDTEPQEYQGMESGYEGIFSAARIGLWSILTYNGHFTIDFDMITQRIMGFPDGMAKSEFYDFWHQRINPDYVEAVDEFIGKIKSGIPSEVIYPYMHPELGTITVRCGGVFDYTYKGKEIRINGYHQDITEFNEKLLHQMEISSALQRRFNSVIDMDLVSGTGKVLWDPYGEFAPTTNDEGITELDFSPYYYHFTLESREVFKMISDPKWLSHELKGKKMLSYEIESVKSGWYMVSFVPSEYNRDGTAARCIYFTEHIDEKKREELRHRRLLEEYLSKENRDRAALVSLASIYDTMHLLDLKERKYEELNARAVIHNLILSIKEDSLQTLFCDVIRSRYSGSNLEAVLKFIDLDTLPRRMKKKNNISLEMVNDEGVWFRLAFIRIKEEGDELSKVIFVSQNIDEAKREQQNLILRSTTDELTGVFNRYSYERYVEQIESRGIGDNLWFIGIDLNGLKAANDERGHAAGDEMIIALTSCVKSSLLNGGKIFRVGGDEFSVIVRGDEKQIVRMIDAIEKRRKKWHGKFSSEFSFSKGIVCSKEMPGCSVSDMEKEADRRMYVEKRSYHNRTRK